MNNRRVATQPMWLTLQQYYLIEMMPYYQIENAIKKQKNNSTSLSNWVKIESLLKMDHIFN